MSETAISAVCLLGSRSERLPRMLSALASQTAGAELEVVFVGGGDGPGEVPGGLRSRRVPWPPGLSYGEARAEGARQASGEIVAFLLDHCYPEPDWAEGLIGAYRGQPWAAVGYGFRNANPESHASRATFLANFGPWETAPSGEVAVLPGNNLSYRRRDLVALGSELGELLDIDASVHRRFHDAGLRMAVEPRAVVVAECFESVLEASRSNQVYGRLLAVRRAETERWRFGRRALYALAAPVVATAVRIARIWRGSANRRRELLRCLPALATICIGWALGESRGYLLGEGRAAGRLVHWELEAIRARG